MSGPLIFIQQTLTELLKQKQEKGKQILQLKSPIRRTTTCNGEVTCL